MTEFEQTYIYVQCALVLKSRDIIQVTSGFAMKPTIWPSPMQECVTRKQLLDYCLKKKRTCEGKAQKLRILFLKKRSLPRNVSIFQSKLVETEASASPRQVERRLEILVANREDKRGAPGSTVRKFGGFCGRFFKLLFEKCFVSLDSFFFWLVPLFRTQDASVTLVVITPRYITTQRHLERKLHACY